MSARFLGRCGKCRTAVRIEGDLVSKKRLVRSGFQTYSASVIVGLTVTRGSPGVAELGALVEAWRSEAGRTLISVRCPNACVGIAAPVAVLLTMVQGRRTDAPCNAKCMASTRHVCECSCGGANHGGGVQ